MRAVRVKAVCQCQWNCTARHRPCQPLWALRTHSTLALQRAEGRGCPMTRAPRVSCLGLGASLAFSRRCQPGRALCDLQLDLKIYTTVVIRYIVGKHPIYLIYDSGHTNIPQVLEIWPNIPIYLMQAGQQSKYQYTSPTHVITIRYVIDMEYTRCDRIGRF